MQLRWKVDEYKKDGKAIALYNEIRILDSLQFLSTSLAELMDQITQLKDDSLYPHLKSGLDNDKIFEVSKKKGLYPYEYIDSLQRLDETCLPAIQEFKIGGLNSNQIVSEGDYQSALNVWNLLGCKTLWDYTSFYLKVDVLGLADVFEKFRVDCVSGYGLDAVFFYSLPGLGWAAMLRKSKVCYTQLTDYEMYCFFEEGIRGGLCQVSKHHVKADNIYVSPGEHSRENDLSRYLYLFDANSLYPWAMVQPLPYGEHRWLDDVELKSLFPPDNLSDWPDEFGAFGYTLMVDLEYPPELHDLTESLPLAPAHETVDIRDYSLEMLFRYKNANPEKQRITKEKKLLATCHDKESYVVHFRALKFYLEMGMRLKKIHRGVAYKQSCYMKDYIDYNIEQRKKWMSDKARSDFYKKLNNAVFGKTQEQQRKHMNFQLEARTDKQMILLGKDTYIGEIVFQPELVGFYMAKNKMVLKHPIYVGQAILDISKLLIYKFFYRVLKPLFSEISVVYTDTDSLLLNISDVNVDEKLAKIRDSWLDCSNMPTSHPLYSLDNKGKLGYFKDEMSGKVIEECICLRPKMYALKSQEWVKKTAKGINKTVVKKQLRFDDYVKVYESVNNDPLYVTQKNFTSKKHIIYTTQQTKKGLALFDNKRYWHEKNESLPYGHKLSLEMQRDTLNERSEFVSDYFGVDIRLPPKLKRQVKPYSYPHELGALRPSGVLYDSL